MTLAVTLFNVFFIFSVPKQGSSTQYVPMCLEEEKLKIQPKIWDLVGKRDIRNIFLIATCLCHKRKIEGEWEAHVEFMY